MLVCCWVWGWDYPLHLGVTGRLRHAGVLLGVGLGLSSALGCDRQAVWCRVRHAGVLLGVGLGLSSALGCDR